MRKLTLQQREDTAKQDAAETNRVAPAPEEELVEDEDILDREAMIIAPPPRASGTIRVKLVYAGRSKPPVVDEDDVLMEEPLIENPPRGPSRKIKVRFVQAGYCPPKIVDDPRD